MNYTPLYIQTDYTFLTSMITIDKLIDFAKKHQIKSLALCDQNMFGAMEFYHKCKQNDIHPILGLEIFIDEKSMVLLAKNYQGYQNLTKLTTLSSERKLMIEDLQKYQKEIIFITENSLLYHQMKKETNDIFLSFSTLEKKSEDGIYMKKIQYLTEEDKKYYPYLKAMKMQKLVISMEDQEESFHLCLDEQLWTENNLKIKDWCHIEFPKNEMLLPIYPCPDHKSSEEYLYECCIKGLQERHLQDDQYKERLEYEYQIIQKMGFCNYFLIVMDYVHYAKTHHILVGPGRGSAAGSLVSYLLGITDIDPLKYHLLFERFLNPERVTMPDIDVDFEYTKREEMILYCILKYGMKKVAPIITFGTLAAKQVLRDVGRVMDIDVKTMDLLTKKIDSKQSLMENYKQNKQISDWVKNSKEIKKLYQVALKFEGMKRHSSIHAAGIVMSQVDLDDIIPLDKSHEQFYVTGYSMEYLENLGLLKMDFLAIKNLTMIKDIVDEVNEKEGENLRFETIVEDDEGTLSIFTKADTVGIFQFESEGMKSFLKKFKPTSFEDVFSAIALYRPGPMGNIDHFILRKKGKETIDYFHPDLEKILKPTYGIIIYQEQVMQIASKMAGYSLGEADLLRRAMSKKKEEILLKEKDKFIERSIQKGYDAALAAKIYEMILKFASYGFPRAHAVAYSMISYKMAYLKYYYPMYFYKHLLNMGISSDKLKDYILECKGKNIKIMKPNINESEKEYKVTDEGILFPLLGIKNVGLIAVEEIIKERKKGLFQDIFDFISRCYGKSMNREVIQSLIYAGCFDSFHITRSTLIFNLDILIHYADIIKDLGREYALVPELEYQEEFSDAVKNEKEFEVFGCYLGEHPTVKYKAKYEKAIFLRNLSKYFDQIVIAVVFVEKIKEITTKNNQKMSFLSVSDEYEVVDAVMFPNIYEEYSYIQRGDIILIKAKVERRVNQYQMVIQKLKKIA